MVGNLPQVIQDVVGRKFQGQLTCSCKPIHTQCEDLYPEEYINIKDAVSRRQTEFTVGRSCAREALSNLGQIPCPIPVGDFREPVWPESCVGSITHDGDYCVAVAAHSKNIDLVGIDLAKREPLDKKLIELVCRSEEVLHIAERGEGSFFEDPYKIIFSLKESVFKSMFSLVGKYFDFQDVSVLLNVDGSATIKLENDDLFSQVHRQLSTEVVLTQGYIFTVVWSSRN